MTVSGRHTFWQAAAVKAATQKQQLSEWRGAPGNPSPDPFIARKVYDKCVPRLSHRIRILIGRKSGDASIVNLHSRQRFCLAFVLFSHLFLFAHCSMMPRQLSAAITQLSAWLNYKNCIMMKVIAQRRFRFRFRFQYSLPWPTAKSTHLAEIQKTRHWILTFSRPAQWFKIVASIQWAIYSRRVSIKCVACKRTKQRLGLVFGSDCSWCILSVCLAFARIVGNLI